MSNTNYISTIVKLLEDPERERHEEVESVCKVRAQFSSIRNESISELVLLAFWGNGDKEILDYYQQHDYLIVEGSIALKSNFETELSEEYLEINVLKIYPFLLPT